MPFRLDPGRTLGALGRRAATAAARALVRTRLRASGLRRDLGSALLELLFPPICRVCGEAIGPPASTGAADGAAGGDAGGESAGDAPAPLAALLCRGCAASVRWIGRACAFCGMPVLLPSPGPEDARCEECRGRPLHFDRVLAAGTHDGALRRLVLIHKSRADPGLVRGLAALVAWVYERRAGPALPPTDAARCTERAAVVPLPSHWLNVFLRGRDPARELASAVAAQLGLPLRPVLRRARWARKQVGLPRAARLRNQVGAFGIRPRTAAPPSVLLIDDVVTTGATMSDAARALKRAGTRRVVVLAIARSRT